MLVNERGGYDRGSDDMESSVDEEDEKMIDEQLDEDGAPAIVNRRLIRTQSSLMRGLASRFERTSHWSTWSFS